MVVFNIITPTNEDDQVILELNNEKHYTGYYKNYTWYVELNDYKFISNIKIIIINNKKIQLKSENIDVFSISSKILLNNEIIQLYPIFNKKIISINLISPKLHQQNTIYFNILGIKPTYASYISSSYENKYIITNTTQNTFENNVSFQRYLYTTSSSTSVVDIHIKLFIKLYNDSILQDDMNYTIKLSGTTNTIDLNNSIFIKKYISLQLKRELEIVHQITDTSIMTESMVWCSLNWLKEYSEYIDEYPKYLFPLISTDIFEPKHTSYHRKLYKCISSYNNNKIYLFSPCINSPNKWTPLYEIYNYKLAKLLIIPENTLYFPECFEGFIHHLGIGSFKEFITINKKKTIKISDLDISTKTWLIMYDYLICNIERDWIDHLCIDIYNKINCLDNDLGINHENDYTNPPCDKNFYDNLNIQTKNILQNLNTNHPEFINAPYNWKVFITKRIKQFNQEMNNFYEF